MPSVSFSNPFLFHASEFENYFLWMDRVNELKTLCEVLGLDLKQKILEEVDDSVDNVNEWLMKEQNLGRQL